MRDRERRHVCRLIDLAVDRCEKGNLREQLEVPRSIADLIVSLQAAAGEPLSVPRDTITARGQLLDLRQGYMARRSTSEPERRLCVGCHQPLSPFCRRPL
ncbi:MAG: hypothetical protein DLM58_08255 [Pseudonocardiales bacterium]|nr:MAG: hypothetical protein DLM58_08255 [Pseudonocardiales bacterium]